MNLYRRGGLLPSSPKSHHLREQSPAKPHLFSRIQQWLIHKQTPHTRTMEDFNDAASGILLKSMRNSNMRSPAKPNNYTKSKTSKLSFDEKTKSSPKYKKFSTI